MSPKRSANILEILFLGTGAADWPLQIDKNETFFRRRSSILINQHMLVDCGDNIPGVIPNPKAITDIIYTHSHPDHYSLQAIEKLLEMGPDKIRIWLSPQFNGKLTSNPKLKFEQLAIGRPVQIAELFVTAFEANHYVSDNEIPLNLFFCSGMTKFLYATDGAWLFKQTIEHLKKNSPIGAIIFDATIGEVEGDYRVFEHNSIDMIRLMVSSLKNSNVLNDKSKIILTHLAKTLHPTQNETEKQVEQDKFIVAFDGLSLQIKNVQPNL